MKFWVLSEFEESLRGMTSSFNSSGVQETLLFLHLHLFRTLWICWSLESLTYWPALVLSREERITLQRIMTSLLFRRGIQNRRMNYCLEKWESQFTTARCWQKVQADARAPGEHRSVGRGQVGRSTSGQGNGSSCLKTRTVLPSKHTGKHFLETQLKIIVLIFYVNG